jgi:hypothetical protein
MTNMPGELTPHAEELITQAADKIEQAIGAVDDNPDAQEVVVDGINETLQDAGYKIVPVEDVAEDDVDVARGRIAGLTRDEIRGGRTHLSLEKRQKLISRIRSNLPGITPPPAQV